MDIPYNHLIEKDTIVILISELLIGSLRKIYIMSLKFAILALFLIFLYPVSADINSLAEESMNNSGNVQDNSMVSALDRIITEIQDELDLVKEQNKISAESLKRSGLSGSEATKILSEKLSNVAHGHSSLIISKENDVTAASPIQFTSLIGSNLGYQNETRFANERKEPVISNIFYLEEGFYGISISYPIFSDKNEYLGYTDVTIRPEEFLRPILVPFTEQTGYEVFILETGGMTVYETSEAEIGTNVLTDPIYDTNEMRNVSRTVVENKEGAIEYTFWNQNWDKQVRREAVWTSLEQDNQEWRIGLVKNLDNSNIENRSVSQISSSDLDTSISDLKQFVQDAAVAARMKGKENACADFNNLSGAYVTDDMYIFAYDMNGTTLALPYQQGLIGKSRMDLTDVNGLSIMPAFLDAAKRGGGFLYYIYKNPQNEYQNQLKLSLIEPVDENWFIGSGVYVTWINAELNQEDIKALINRVKHAVSHAQEVGKEQAVKDFNDINQSFANGGSYIFAYGYDGTTLALPYQPEIIGTNRMNYLDMYGVPIIAQEIYTAERGGGFVYVVYYNPDTANNELKLCYVLPAGDDWLIGSGIYTGTNLI